MFYFEFCFYKKDMGGLIGSMGDIKDAILFFLTSSGTRTGLPSKAGHRIDKITNMRRIFFKKNKKTTTTHWTQNWTK